MEISTNTRSFVFKHSGNDMKLADPDPRMSPTQVMSFYANQHPALTNATVVDEGWEDDQRVFRFKSTVGTKG